MSIVIIGGHDKRKLAAWGKIFGITRAKILMYLKNG